MVVSPAAPREDDGTYWGYTTRLASSIKQALDECPFPGGYDLRIGTSERGNETVESASYSVPAQYKHAIIVFGGVAGIEECVDADESIKLPGSKSHTLFDQWVNICPLQGSRTIRTEEAVMIALAKLSPKLLSNMQSDQPTRASADTPSKVGIQLSDDENISEESSDSDIE
jgi:predicted SPOUT superfamily RNA methylase MTH1